MVVPPTAALTCPALIGRVAERDALLALANAAWGGQGTTVLLAGEAGVGKSRLVGEVLSFTHRGTVPLAVQGRSFEADGALPYGPVVDLLRAHFAGRPPEVVGVELGASAPEIVKLLPELAQRLPGLLPSAALEPEQEKHRLFETLSQFFARLASKGPLLIVVEDLHWADDLTLEWIARFARRLPTLPILLVLTYRDDEVAGSLAACLAALARDRLGHVVQLAPLDLLGVEGMLRAIFDLSRPPRADFLQLLHTLTEGNPFFIEEVLKSLLASGDIFFANGRWDRKPVGELRLPRTALHAVQRRLAALSPAARELLALAAVAGRQFDFDVLARRAGHDERTLLRLLRELIGAQLVVEESPDRFVFRHALTRHAAYASLLGRERQALHRALAENIAAEHRDALELQLPDLVRHYHAAGCWEEVREYAPRAAERAWALNAPRTAIAEFSRAVQAAERLGVPPALAVCRGRGQAYALLGDFGAAREDYERALAITRADGDPAGECQSLLDLGWLWTERDYARAGEYFDRAIALARVTGDAALLGATLNRVGNWYLHSERSDEARACHEEALALFRASGDGQGEAMSLDLLGITAYMGSDQVVGAKAYGEAVALCRRLDLRQGLSSALASLSILGPDYRFLTVVWQPNDADALFRMGDEAIAIARQIGWRAGEATALLYRCFTLGPRGRFDEALAAGQASLAIASELGHRVWTASVSNALAMTHYDLLDLARARQHAERGWQLTAEIGSRFLVNICGGFLGLICIAQGDLAQARSVLATALTPETPMQSIGQRIAWHARAELALAEGDAPAALAIVDRLIASAPNGGPGVVILYPWYLRARGLVAAGQPGLAREVIAGAIGAARSFGVPALHWRLLVCAGQLEQSQGRREEAELAFGEARALIEALAEGVGDPALRANFRGRALAQLPQRPEPTALRAAKERYGGLTAREREVAALLAGGRSNRDIAAELSLSERTVGAHIGNILGKLGFASRAQIAVWAVEQGLGQREG
ncbi:MAG: AAA family ATPase [Thermomicrobiales bacterium]